MPITKYAESLIDAIPGLQERGHELAHGLHDAILKGGEPTRTLADVLHGTWLGHPLHVVPSPDLMPATHADTDAVRDHYDRISVFYRAFWGDHIHHGYWEEDEDTSARDAQERLVALLAERADIPERSKVLDVGCGVGGSARWLAVHLGCHVDGITLSPVQADMATARARKEDLDGRVRVWVHDARDLDALDADYDAVWTVECSEHLEDKAGFVRAAARRLRPGGAFALCAWLRGSGPSGGDGLDAEGESLVASVCDGMLCPSLATMDEYAGWMREAGFEDVQTWDLTPHVARTWDLCAAVARWPEVRALLAVSDGRARRFVEAFPAMQRAYAEGAMRYGMLVGHLPGTSEPASESASQPGSPS